MEGLGSLAGCSRRGPKLKKCSQDSWTSFERAMGPKPEAPLKASELHLKLSKPKLPAVILSSMSIQCPPRRGLQDGTDQGFLLDELVVPWFYIEEFGV